MKKNIFLLMLLVIPFVAFEQTAGTTKQPAYLANPTIPSLNLISSDSAHYSNTDLPKGVPIVIIYFSPDCSHCQHEAEEISSKMAILKNAYFLWVSYHPLNEIKEFEKKYKLDQFSNIKVTRDPKYYIPAFYKVQQTPFIAIYNSNGDFVKEFREGVKTEDLAAALK